ncbi:tRNA uridine-5-carboxymethylaminomethyl(34) synthesis GTPase MnmE, partial [Xanthomonas sp. Kuri4-1]
LALIVVDARDPAAGRAAVADAVQDVPTRLWIHNKSDLLDGSPADAVVSDADTVSVSAATGAGLASLHERLRTLACGDPVEAVEGEFSARSRHVEALRRAGDHAVQADAQLRHEQLELAAEELRLAHDALGEITGKLSADDLLGRIFSSFCIGK